MTVADNMVRLGMALGAIMLVTVCLYQFGSRQAVAIEPMARSLSLK